MVIKFLQIEIALVILIFLLGTGMRFYKLTSIPPGLYIDEVSIGYNAASILKTGNDEYGQKFPMAFRAFGEYKMPVYIYLTSASIFIFGKSEFAVRFPSFLFGSLSIVLFYLFLKQLVRIEPFFINKRKIRPFILISTFLFTILPWNVMFSRAGFEANVALFFYLVSCVFFLYSLFNKRLFSIFLSFSALVITLYTYNAFRFIEPVTLIFFSFILFRRSVMKRYIVTLFLIALLASLPMLLSTFSLEGSARFHQASAFKGYSNLPFFKKIIVYPLEIFRNYLSYFTFSYLFSLGDGFDRQRVIGFGPLFRFELPLLLLGIYLFLKKSRGFAKKFILFLLFVAPATGAFTAPSPHELRSLLLVVPLTVFVGIGLTELFYIRGKFIKIFLPLVMIVIFYNIFSFYHAYFGQYSNDSIVSWGGGFKQVVAEATAMQHNYKYIVLNELLGNDYAFFKFYNPDLVYTETKKNQIWQKPKDEPNARVLYITESPKDRELKYVKHKFLKNIYLPNLNHDVFAVFYEL